MKRISNLNLIDDDIAMKLICESESHIELTECKLISNVKYVDLIEEIDKECINKSNNNCCENIEKEVNLNLSIRELMYRNLITGINTPLNPKSKGYRILNKMGYVDGEKLGKNGKGLNYPIDIIPHLAKIKERVNNQTKTTKFYQKEKNCNENLLEKVEIFNNLKGNIMYITNRIISRNNSLNLEHPLDYSEISIPIRISIVKLIELIEDINKALGNLVKKIAGNDDIENTNEIQRNVVVKMSNIDEVIIQIYKTNFLLGNFSINGFEINSVLQSFNVMKKFDIMITRLIELLKFTQKKFSFLSVKIKQMNNFKIYN